VLPTYSARPIPRIKARTIVRHHGDTPPARGLVALAQFAACPNRAQGGARARVHPREAKKQQTKQIHQSNASLPASVAQTAL